MPTAVAHTLQHCVVLRDSSQLTESGIRLYLPSLRQSSWSTSVASESVKRCRVRFRVAFLDVPPTAERTQSKLIALRLFRSAHVDRLKMSLGFAATLLVNLCTCTCGCLRAYSFKIDRLIAHVNRLKLFVFAATLTVVGSRCFTFRVSGRTQSKPIALRPLRSPCG